LNKLAIPAILAATVMVAGAFAFMPVDQATTVHGDIVSALAGAQIIRAETLVSSVFNGAGADGATITYSLAGGEEGIFRIEGLLLCDLETAAGTVITYTTETSIAGTAAGQLQYHSRDFEEWNQVSLRLNSAPDDRCFNISTDDEVGVVISLTGDEDNDVIVTLTHNGLNASEDDGQTLVAYVSGLETDTDLVVTVVLDPLA